MGERTRSWRRAQRDRYMWKRMRYFIYSPHDFSGYGRKQTFNKLKGILKQSCDACKEWKLMCLLGMDVLCIKKSYILGMYAKWNGTCDCGHCRDRRDDRNPKKKIERMMAKQEIIDAQRDM
jgi:hypothetical protein